MLEFGEVFGAEELIDLVEENPERSAYGRFVDLSNDLGAFVDNYKRNKENHLVMMAYAYARRIAVAGIYFQTIVGSDYFEYVNDLFKNWQGLTDGSYEFQEAAMSQALEILSFYVPELDRKKFSVLVQFAEQEIDFTKLAQSMGIELDVSDDPGAYYPISAVSALLDEYYQIEADSEGSVDWEFLSDSIPMSEPSGWGGFVDMHNDIAAVTPLLDENSDPLLLLGVAEAATIAALGSFIQGFMSEGDLDQSYRILLKAQDWAGEEAVERLTGVAKMQAAVLTSRYIEEFRPHYAEILFTAAQSGITLPRLGIPKDHNGFYSVQSVLRLLDPDRFS